MNPELSLATIRGRVEGIQREADYHRQLLIDLDASVRAIRKAWQSRLPGVLNEIELTHRRQHDRQRSEIARSTTQARQAAHSIASAATETLSPRFLSAELTSPQWTSPDVGVHLGSHLRIGYLSATSPVPVIAPLLGTAGWAVVANPTSFTGLVHAIALRLLFAAGPSNVRITVFDPDFNCDFGLFADIKRISKESLPTPISATDDLEFALEDLLTSLRATDEALSSEGFDSFLAAHTETGQLAHPIQVLVLAGSLRGLSERGQARVEQLLKVGSARGLIVVAQRSAVSDLAGSDQLTTLTLEGQSGDHCSALPGIQFLSDSPPARTRVLELCAVLAAMPKKDTARTIDFAEINTAQIENGWLDAGDEGIEAVIGQVGRHLLTVALRSENPPMPNALVGGAVGQGKSNLLLVLIHSLASKYAPTDLQMILLDLKDGVEFSQLGPDDRGRNWLPHVLAMGLEFDLHFALATLRWTVAEMSSRATKMRAAGVSKIGDYRKVGAMPRLLIVIDEFQRLFEGDDNSVDEAATLLEQIARTGRSYGVHVVLASQTISGIRGLAAKSDAIFGQFHNRISMKNTPSESAAILAPTNTAAAQLRNRGEVVLNDALGDPDSNVIGVAAYADSAYLAECRRRMWADAGTSVPPTVFRATSFATLPAGYAMPAGKYFAVGKAITLDDTVRGVPMQNTVAQAVAVLGTDELLASLVLRSGFRSLIPAINKVTMLDGLGIGTGGHDWLDELIDDLRNNGIEVEVVARQDIGRTVAELSVLTAESESRPDVVLALALDGCTELEEPNPSTYEAPTKALQHLAQISSSIGIHMIGWWHSRTRLESQLGYGAPAFRAWCFCRTPTADIQAICGPLVKGTQSSQRVLFYDSQVSTTPEVLVPFGSQQIRSAM